MVKQGEMAMEEVEDLEVKVAPHTLGLRHTTLIVMIIKVIDIPIHISEPTQILVVWMVQMELEEEMEVHRFMMDLMDKMEHINT